MNRIWRVPDAASPRSASGGWYAVGLADRLAYWAAGIRARSTTPRRPSWSMYLANALKAHHMTITICALAILKHLVAGYVINEAVAFMG